MLAQIDEPAVGRRARSDQLLVGGGVAELHKDGQVPGELPPGRHQQHGRGGQPDRQGADGAGHHAGRPPEEDHELGPEHPRPD